MARSFNQATLMGTLGRDAETAFTASGIAKTTFSLATNRRYKKGEEWVEETTWHNIVLWRSENLANYLTKGKQVFVAGRIDNRSYEKDGQKRYISEIIADEVLLCGGGGDKQAVPAKPATRKADSVDADSDEVPF